jgi:hypothetical protein
VADVESVVQFGGPRHALSGCSVLGHRRGPMGARIRFLTPDKRSQVSLSLISDLPLATRFGCQVTRSWRAIVGPRWIAPGLWCWPRRRFWRTLTQLQVDGHRRLRHSIWGSTASQGAFIIISQGRGPTNVKHQLFTALQVVLLGRPFLHLPRDSSCTGDRPFSSASFPRFVPPCV